jgi:hypothetical protein
MICAALSQSLLSPRKTNLSWNRPASAIDLDAQPGHKIRRMHQIAAADFLEESVEHGVTPALHAKLLDAHGELDRKAADN